MKQDLILCFGVVDCNNEGYSYIYIFFVVMEKSMTNEWEEKDVTMVILMGYAIAMVIVLFELL